MIPQSIGESQCNQTLYKTDEFKDSDFNHLKVVFRPYWTENPYQKLLIANLEKLGVQIGDLNSPKKSSIMAEKPDVLHLHWLEGLFHFRVQSTIMSLLRLVKFLTELCFLRLMGVKIVWTVHDLKHHEKLYPLLDKIATFVVANLAHAIIIHSEIAKGEIASTINIRNKNKIFVVPHGNYNSYYENKIDRLEARKALDIPSSSFVFLFLGEIRPYKGVLELIAAFKKLSLNQSQLVIAGRTLIDTLAEQIRHEIEGDDNIKFIPGFVPDDQIQVYMNACDVVVLPYQNLLTSGAVVLAMSFGKVCVVPRRSYFTEVLNDSGAFFYDPDVAEGLLQAMHCAIQRKTELQSMGDHNRQVSQQWGWGRVAEMTLDVYKQSFSGGRKISNIPES